MPLIHFDGYMTYDERICGLAGYLSPYCSISIYLLLKKFNNNNF